jgi:hypothetical protein
MRKSGSLFTVMLLVGILLLAGCKAQSEAAATEAAFATEVVIQYTQDAALFATAETGAENVGTAQPQPSATAALTQAAQAQPSATSAATATSAPSTAPSATAQPPTATQSNTALPTSDQTALAAVQSTAAAETMSGLVQELASADVIQSVEGEYVRLPFTFDQEWAQIGYYQWTPTELQPVNFVLRTDASWDSASDTPNPSGCGIVLRKDANDNHYMIYLSMTGSAILGELKNGSWISLKEEPVAGLTFPQGAAEITVAVDEEWIVLLVNGEEALRYGSLVAREGELALTIVSGTNKGFGTACKMENVDVWILN